MLRETPADRPRYTATAIVLLTTAAVAAVSATFALTMAVRLPLGLAIPAGIGWGLVILNLDRMLILGMTRDTSPWRNGIGITARLLLAVLLGIVISTPLVLRIFEREINAELEVLQSERVAAFEEQLQQNPRYAAIPELERELARQQAVADQSPDGQAAEDPGVMAAKEKVAATKEVYLEAEKSAQCEIDGNCGTNQPGIGESARQKMAARDRALADYEAAQAELVEAQARARDASTAESRSAAFEAERLRADIEDRRADRKREQDQFADRTEEDGGLLGRIEAKSSLADRRPGIGTASLLLTLLFMALEVLPVLMKVLQLLAPPTVYEQLISRMEREAKANAARKAAYEQTIIDDRDQRRVDLEFHQAELQYAAGQRTNERLVNEQEAIAADAIARWAATARGQSRQAVDTWAAATRQPQWPPHGGYHHNGNNGREPTLPLRREWR
ncbi:hypothetical protein GCM10010171_57360 [Actinokineospora fastidiosa]|uniref:DUF4407 domain-containing protein n=1 Tax=Actinokineospora fastidiosa TaxID=1816 RepID=A0A918GSE8_9PSEU|nr:hypothetical protein GCM10010171_57360 [Actinokineospora fastidiosa]